MSWKDRKTEIKDEGQEYPFVQWVNRGGDLDPRRNAGGFFMVEEQLKFSGLTVEQFGTKATLIFSNGDSASGAFAPRLTLVPLAERFAWVSKDAQNRAQFSQKYTDGARGKKQVLAVLFTANDQPAAKVVVLTMTGTVTNDLSNALKAHRQRVRTATGGKAPACFFALTLQAGAPVQRGKQGKASTVTPLELVPEFTADANYIGDALADVIEAEYAVYQAWAAAWQNHSQASAEAELDAEPDTEYTPPAPPPMPQSTAPAAPQPGGNAMREAQRNWSAAWKEATGRQLQPGRLNTRWSVEEINAATAAVWDAVTELNAGGDLAVIQGDLSAQLLELSEPRPF